MLEQIVNSNAVYIIMAVVVAVGVLVKVMVGATLKRLVKASENMSKSTHGFMRLVKAKFEHACMVNDKVENIPIFVEKYIREYSVLGVRIRGWQRLEKILIVLGGLFTVAVTGIAFFEIGNQELALQYGSVGIGMIIALIGISQLTDERYKLDSIEMYMVDYLENVYSRRFVKEMEEPIRPMIKEEIRKEREEKKEKEVQEEEPTYGGVGEDPTVAIEALKKEELGNNAIEQLILEEVERREMRAKAKGEQEAMPNKVLIREILQEFLA